MGHVDLIHLWSDSPLFVNFSLVGCASLHIVFPCPDDYWVSLPPPPPSWLKVNRGTHTGLWGWFFIWVWSELWQQKLLRTAQLLSWSALILDRHEAAFCCPWYDMCYVVTMRLCFSLKPFGCDVGMWRLACKGPFFKEVQERCLLPSKVATNYPHCFTICAVTFHLWRGRAVSYTHLTLPTNHRV